MSKSSYSRYVPLSIVAFLAVGLSQQATRAQSVASGAAPSNASAPADAQSAASNGAKAASSYTQSGYGQYPRVTEVEQQLLGKTYEKEPLTTRLTRLETKQFGKATPNADLADRIDRLDALLPPKPAPQDDSTEYVQYPAQNASDGTAPAAQPPAGPAVTSQGGGSDPNQPQYSASDYGSYPRVTELEQQLLGSTYVKDPLPVRVARLETKEFGKTTPNDDLCDRIDRLDKMANPHKQVRTADSDSSAGADGSGQQQGNRGGNGGKSGTIGKALLGMLGGVMGGGMFGNGIGNGMTMNQMMPGLQEDMRKDQAAERQQKPAAAQGKTAAPPASPFAPGAPQVVGNESRLAVIEKMVLGKEHAELQITERVEHLEKKLVPWEHNNAGKDLSARVDHLWSILAVANKPSTKAVAASQGPPQ
jgi:hypothetical protein